MGSFDSYRYERGIKPGMYWVEVLEAAEGLTKEKQIPKITVVVRPNTVNMRVFETIVQGDKFNWRMSLFFDCFNIERGNFDFATWSGAIGLVELKEDGNFMRIGRYIPYDEAVKGDLHWEGPKPERQTITSIPSADSYPANDDRRQAAADDDDELPF